MTNFWWYTRKKEIAIAANGFGKPNLRAYLILNPSAEYPDKETFPYGITYLFGEGLYHKNHAEILKDERLIAIFPLKRGKSIEDPSDYGLSNHPKMCKEKYLIATSGRKGEEVCLSCSGRCNFAA